MRLQAGTVEALYNGQKSNPLQKSPVLQITTLSKLTMGENEKPRYKANVSDGQFYMKAVFSSDLSSLFEESKINKFFLIRTESFTVRTKEVNKYLYIQTIAESQSADAEIGNPMNIGNGKLSLDPTNVNENNIHENQNIKNRNDVNTKSDFNLKNQENNVPIKRTSIPLNSKKNKEVGNDVFTEIKDLSPFQSKWIIKGRVVSKSDIRKFNSTKGEGKLFSFEIADKSCQVKCVAFSECVDIFYPLIENNKVFTISQGTIKMANKKFTSNNFDYEIQLEKNSEVQKIEDDDVPQYLFSFIKIADLSVGSNLADIVGVIKEVYPVATVTVKSTGKDLSKRELTIIDETGNARLTLWGAKAEEEYEKDSVICLKSAKVGEYNGIVLSTTASTEVHINCDIPEVIDIMGWYQSEGKNVVVEKPKRTVKRQFIGEIKDNNLEYATLHASIMYVKEDNIYYESCPSENCNKKVSLEDNGNYRCERCNYTYDKCNYRYMISVHVGDFTGQIWVTLFDEVGRNLLGMSAQQLKEMGDENAQDLQNLVKGLISQELQLKVKVTESTYNGETKVKYNCLGIAQIDIESETKKMLEIIEKISI